MEPKKIIKFIVIVLISIGIAIWAYQYYGQKVFHVNTNKYEEASSSNNVTVYTTSHASAIKLTAYEDYKEIEINGELYIVKEEQPNRYEDSYSVLYPTGNYYTVKSLNNDDFLVPFDENGEMYSGFSIYVNNERVLSPGEEFYHPSNLVTIAYEQYHENQGNVALFIISVLFFIFSWLLFSVKALQMALFYMSHRLDVVDPEPTDFYFTSTKFGAVFGMIASIVFFIMSLN